MGILKTKIAEKHKKSQIVHPGAVTHALCVPTGFDLIDYHCATICVNDDGDEFFNLGIPMGKIVLFCGNSQGGKTTLAIQMASNMVAQLNGDIVLCDYERSSNNLSLRVRQITGCTEEEFEERFTVFNQLDMSTEFFKKLIFDIAEMKKGLTKKDFVEYYDIKGNPLLIYPPTVVILDSIPAMKPDEVLKDPDLDNNMIAGKMAAANSAVLKSITALLEQYNITIFGINHITTKIITNKYAPKKIQLPGLDESENLPGGNGWVYVPSYVFKLTSGRELKVDKDSCEGRMTECRILKSRSGFNNKRLPIVLTGRSGFSNILTNFETLKEAKFVKGGGRGGSYFEGAEDSKFTLKTFYKKYRTDEALQETFDNLVAEHYSEYVNTKYEDMDADTAPSDAEELEDEFDE